MRYSATAGICLMVFFFAPAEDAVPMRPGVASDPNQELRSSLPPSLEALNCEPPGEGRETATARFARKGGKDTLTQVRREGDVLTIADVAQGRDLALYERMELSDPNPSSNGRARNASIIPKARSFLWEHWRDRRAGYLILTLSTADATSTSHVFVEKDNVGRWRFAWRIVRHYGRVHDLPTFYAVAWVIPGGSRKPGTPLQPGDVPDPTKHELEFRDKCGDVEKSF